MWAFIPIVNLMIWLSLAMIWIAIAFWPAKVASRKGFSFIGFFLLSLLFFPARADLGVLVEGPHWPLVCDDVSRPIDPSRCAVCPSNDLLRGGDCA